MTDETSDFDDLLKYKLIRDMTREELIDELITFERERLQDHEMSQLKTNVIELRMYAVRNRMLREAGLRTEPGPMGMLRLVEDEESD